VITPAGSFQTPLEVAPLARWRALAGTGGAVLPVRRTQGTFVSGGSGVTVPAVGIPAAGLPLIHGWRSSDGPASLKALAARLSPGGAVRTPGPLLLQGARRISLTAASPAAGVEVSADLRDATGAVTQVPLGLIGARPRTVSARLPAASRELEALELDEPSGERATSGHQIAENPAASPQFSTTVALGPVTVLDASGRAFPSVSVNRWLGVGAAAHARPDGSRLRVRFTASGAPGVIRPPQPSDTRPIPILVDPGTAAAASRQGRIALTIDGLPINGRIVGVLKRFPTLADDAAGFVIADQARPDELWIDTTRPRSLRAALGEGPLSRLGARFRSTVQQQLRDEPIAVGTLGTLAAAAGLAAALAVIGLLAALAGALREPRVERDLEVQGLGPRALRRELRLRILVAGGLGVLCGAALAVALTGLAVAAVRAGATLEPPRPPLVTVVPWAELALGAVALLAVFAAASWMAADVVVSRGSRAR
jgi:hypothetical protein